MAARRPKSSNKKTSRAKTIVGALKRRPARRQKIKRGKELRDDLTKVFKRGGVKKTKPPKNRGHRQ